MNVVRIIVGLLLLLLGAVGYDAMRRYKSTGIAITIIAILCVIFGLVLLLSAGT